MKKLVWLLAILAPSCGGSGGGSSQAPLAPVVIPAVTLDSVAPNPFTPPAKGTVTYTLSGGAALMGLDVYASTGPNTYQFLGEVMIDTKTPGTATYDWPGTIPTLDGVSMPLFLVSQIDATHGLYLISLQTITQMTNGTTTTSAYPATDLDVYLNLDYTTATFTVDHAVTNAGSPWPFPRSGGVPGFPGWTYYERVKLYDVSWNSSTDVLSYTLNASTIANWANALFNTPSIPGRTYSLETHAQNVSGQSFSPLLSVTTN